jgi:Lon protease-like protein
VLFPGGLLPLRIFEVRYLDMIRRCHREGQPFGVMALSAGQEVRHAGAGPESFHPVGTLARVTEVASPQPGLLMIQTLGGPRFRLRSWEQLKHGLWVGDADAIAEDPAVPIPEDLQPHALALSRLLDALQAQAADAGTRMPVREPWLLEDCAWVANRWCELLPLPVAMKHRLMALDNPLLRLELVGDLLGQSGRAKIGQGGAS